MTGPGRMRYDWSELPARVQAHRLYDQGSRSHAFDEADYPDIDEMLDSLMAEEGRRVDDVAARRPCRRQNRNVRIA